MRVWIALLLFALAGCGDNSAAPTFRIKMIRPDGVLHKEVIVRSWNRPAIHITCGGAQYYGNIDTPYIIAPIGWLLEVEPALEVEM